jgi:hypothetical protein
LSCMLLNIHTYNSLSIFCCPTPPSYPLPSHPSCYLFPVQFPPYHSLLMLVILAVSCRIDYELWQFPRMLHPVPIVPHDSNPGSIF